MTECLIIFVLPREKQREGVTAEVGCERPLAAPATAQATEVRTVQSCGSMAAEVRRENKWTFHLPSASSHVNSLQCHKVTKHSTDALESQNCSGWKRPSLVTVGPGRPA